MNRHQHFFMYLLGYHVRDGGGVAPSGQGSTTRRTPGIAAAASASVASSPAARVVADLEGRAHTLGYEL